MLRNILVITLRNLIRNSLYSTISILGLTVGIAVFLSILTLLRYEYSFNKDIPDAERIFRVYTQFSGAFSGKNPGISNPIPTYIADNYDIIDSYTHFHTWRTTVDVLLGDGTKKELDEKRIILTDTSLFTTIDIWQWEAGKVKSLERPNTVALLRSQAEKYFGDLPSTEYLGREIIYQDSLIMQVVGVLANPDMNTDFKFTDFLSSATIHSSFLKENFNFTSWDNTNSSDNFILKLNPNSTREDLEAILNQTEIKQKEVVGDEGWIVDYIPQPLEELHYNTELGTIDNSSHAADTDILQNLFLVAIAILALAIINFINLETAIGGLRGREVGIRKVLGSSRMHVMMQYLIYSLVLTSIAVFFSVPLTLAGLELFTDFLPEGLTFEPLSFTNLLMYLGIAFGVGLLAGLYPAFILSAYNPIRVLKSNNLFASAGNNSTFLRKGLTVFQFAFSQVLLIVAFISFYQLDYMTSKDLGFNPYNVLYVSTPWRVPSEKGDVFKQELYAIPGIEKISRFGDLPISSGWSSKILEAQTADGESMEAEIFVKRGDSTYMSFFGINKLSGMPANGKKDVYINETLLRELGYDHPQDAVNRLLNPTEDSLRIAGVIADFHFQTLHNEIKPMMVMYENDGRVFGLKLSNDENSQQVKQAAEEAFKAIYPDYTFNMQFYESSINNYYESEERVSTLITGATIIALLISCMGLFGLSSFMALRRTKEIGIRKVQGASVKDILGLLSSDFMTLVLVAIVLAVPTAYYFGQSWLEDFAYKVSLNFWIFAIAGIAAIVIAGLTVSYHSLKATRINPVDCLRSE